MSETTAPSDVVPDASAITAGITDARSPGKLLTAVPYLQAAAVWFCSRLIVFLGVVMGKTYVPLGNDTWLGGDQWYHRLLRWDSEWYKIIATEGYRYNGNPLE